MRDASVRFGLGEREAYDFVYAVNEAVTNAIKHGRAEADGHIGVAIDCDGDTLVCAVTDGGPFLPPPGFASSTLPESGRGFAFMAALTDELELSIGPDATIVRLSKRRNGTDAIDA